jgi:hypothetical protein
MPFCPSCGLEYLPGFKICPDCNEALVDRPPGESLTPEFEKGSFPDVRFVPLPNLPGRVYAEMVKHVLEKWGIPCYIQSDGIGGAYQIVGTGMPGTGAKLYVPEDRLEECLRLQHEMLDHI